MEDQHKHGCKKQRTLGDRIAGAPDESDAENRHIGPTDAKRPTERQACLAIRTFHWKPLALDRACIAPNAQRLGKQRINQIE